MVKLIYLLVESWAVPVPAGVGVRLAWGAPLFVGVVACSHAVGFSTGAACVARFETIASQEIEDTLIMLYKGGKQSDNPL